MLDAVGVDQIVNLSIAMILLLTVYYLVLIATTILQHRNVILD